MDGEVRADEVAPGSGGPRSAAAAYAAAAIAVTALAYWRLPGNFFFADDFLLFYNRLNAPAGEFLLQTIGGHLLVVRNALFLVLARLFGLDPAPYFWLALLTHLVNVALLFVVLRRFTASAPLACCGAAAWGVMPVHGEPLGWHSVYGHALATTAMLAILTGLAGTTRPGRRTLFAWGLLVVLGANSFGVGIGVALVMPAVAFLLRWDTPGRGRVAAAFGVAFLVVAALFFAVPLLSDTLYGTGRGHDVPPIRLDALPFYAVFLLHFLGYASSSLALGIFQRPTLYPGPWTLVPLGALAALVLIGFAVASPRTRRAMIAAALVAGAVYGMAAVARGMFAVAVPDKIAMLARWDRLHYLGTCAIVIVLCLGLSAFGRWSRLDRWSRPLLAVWLGVTIAGYLWVGRPVHTHDWVRREVGEVMRAVREAAEAAPPGATVYVANRPFKSMGPMLERFRDLFPGWGGAFAVYYPDGVFEGRRVRFVDNDRAVVEAARRARRTSWVLVWSGDLPAAQRPGGGSDPKR